MIIVFFSRQPKCFSSQVKDFWDRAVSVQGFLLHPLVPSYRSCSSPKLGSMPLLAERTHLFSPCHVKRACD